MLALAKTRLWVPVLFVAVLVVAGCGGADARKAKHLEKGQAFLAAERYDKARVEFRNALQIAPNDSNARYVNGVVDEKLGNPREAAQFYQGAIDSDADNVQARTALGRLFLFAGVPERALDTIKPGLVKHPEDPGLLTVRAAARTQLKDLNGALEDAEHAVQLAPNSEDAVAVLAGIYKSRGDADKARSLLEGAIKQIPNTVDLRLALAQLYATLSDEPRVEALLIDLTRLKPNDGAHRLRLAQYYARLNHIDESEQVLRQAIKALPGERDLKIALVDFLAARRSREAAGRELAAMIAANPTDDELKFAQARFFEQGKDFAQAESVYRRVIAQAGVGPTGITARNRLAALKVATHDVATAEKLLAEVLGASPRDNDALIMHGNLALAQQDPKTAIADLRSVLRDQPNAVGVMRALARAHLANGEPALAEETMRRAADADPKDLSARLDLVQLLIQLGKAEQAKPLVDALVKQQPDNMAALEAQFKVGAATKDGAEAQGAANAMVALQPKQPLGYFYQGAVAEDDKRLDDALRLYSAALDIQPDAAEPLQAAVRVLVRLDRTAEAIKRLDAAAARFPTLPFALNLKAEVLLNSQHPAAAEQALKTAIGRAPKWWIPYRGLAQAQLVDRDADAAIATLQEGIAISDQPGVLVGELAGLYERMGKSDQAIMVYEEALRRDPQSDADANNLAMLLVTYKKDQASLNRAKALAVRFSASPNGAFLDTYGWVLYKRGESAAAVAALQAALSKAPDSPVSLYHLGMAQASAGQQDAARDSLARSLKSGKKFSGMDEAKAALESLAKLPAALAAAPTS
jgi:tetratricopeptide (TPR) repeat protein